MMARDDLAFANKSFSQHSLRSVSAPRTANLSAVPEKTAVVVERGNKLGHERVLESATSEAATTIFFVPANGQIRHSPRANVVVANPSCKRCTRPVTSHHVVHSPEIKPCNLRVEKYCRRSSRIIEVCSGSTKPMIKVKQ